MNALWQLTTKPWLKTGPDDDIQYQRSPGKQLPEAKFGLRIFLCVATSLFLITITAYLERMSYGDWRPVPETWLLWLNTGILILSSAALQGARFSAGSANTRLAKITLTTAGFLACGFLAGQLLAWQQLDAMGYYLGTNPANTFFYLITAFHGFHLLGGMVALGRTSTKLWRGSNLIELRASIDLCATYWHFLLVIWLILFGLILST